MQALVGAQRNGAVIALESLVGAGRKGLLKQLHPQPRQVRGDAFQLIEAEGLVGVDQQAGEWRGFAHGSEAPQVAGAADLDLQHRAAGGRLGPLGHLRRFAQADCVAGLHRIQPLSPSQEPDAFAAPLGVKIPEGAVHGIARRSVGHQALQRGPVQAGLDGVADRLDLSLDAIDRFAIAGVRHALAAPAGGAVREFDNQDFSLCLGSPRDGEAAGDGPAFAADRQSHQAPSPAAASNSR